MKTLKKTLKAIVPMNGAGLMKALVLSMFFVGLLFLNSCANLMDTVKKGDTAGVNALLNKGADVNVKDKDGYTALMEASYYGHTEIVKALLNKGANVNAKRDEYGETALILASKKGHTETVKALLANGADVNAKEKYGKTALMYASGNGHTKIVQLLRWEDNKKLIEAAEKGDISTVKALIAKGADVNAKDKNGETALMWASRYGHTETVKALLDKGADVNAKDEKGWTALMVASEKGHTEIAKALIAKGADVNAKDKNGYTVLMYASAAGHTDIAKALLDKGADANAKLTRDGKFLGSTSFQGLQAAEEEREPIGKISAFLYSTGLVSGEKNYRYCATALILASAKGHTEMVKALINKGADVNAEVECIKVSVEISLGKRTGFGVTESVDSVTPLMMASGNGHTAIVKLLKAAGAK